MLKNIRKNLEQKNSDNLKKIVLAGIMTGGLMFQNSVAFADPNIYADNTVEVNEDTITTNGETIENEGGFFYQIEDQDLAGDFINNRFTFNGSMAEIFLNRGNFTGNFTGNEFTLNNGNLMFQVFNENPFGIPDDGINYEGTVSNNIFNINGGTFTNEYEYFETAVAQNNTMNINGAPDLSEAYLFGGIFGDFANSSGNTLNINTSGLTARNIYGFDTINFNLPLTVQNGDTILTLTEGNTELVNTTVNANIFDGHLLQPGNTVNLITNENGLNYVGNGHVNVAEGATLTYENSTIAQNGNSLVLTLGNLRLNEDTQAFSQGVVNTGHTLSIGTDRVIDWLPPEELDEAVADGEKITDFVSTHYGVFASMEGSKLRTKTGGGAYIDSKGGGIDLGFARAVEDSNGGSSIFAPLFDYGKTSFDSYLADGTHGKGNSKYVAGGFIGRKVLKNGLYFEGSFRGGSAKTDFTSDDLRSSYNSSTPVFAGHVRVGKLWRMDKNNLMHIYGIYSHNHVNSFGANLSTGEHYDFDAVDSGKFKIGYKLTTRVSNVSKIYTGLAYQYEFNGSTSGHYRNFTTKSSGVKGSSGMFELGWQLQPNKKSAWVVDVNCTGWIGIQKGITASAKIKKSF